MRVLLVSSHYERPGSFTGHPVHRLAQELAEHGAEVQVVCPLPRFTRPSGFDFVQSLLSRTLTKTLDGIPITYLPYANVSHGLSPARDGRRLARRLISCYESLRWRPDLVHAHRVFPTGDAAGQLARRYALPLVVTAHGSDVHTHPKRNAGIAARSRHVIETADRIVAVSRYLAELVLEIGIPRSPVVPIHLGVDASRFRPDSDRASLRERLLLPSEGLGFITVCRLTRRKGVMDLCDSFAAVLKRHPTAWLVFLGDGPARREIEARAVRSGIRESLFFAGARANREVPDWLNAADVFVLASHAEGLPNVVLEAMACGLAVVASDVGGTREAVEHRAGVLVPPADEEALTRALLDVADSPGRREDLGAAALRRATSHFSWNQTAESHLRLYSTVLGSRGTPSEMDTGHDQPEA